MVQHKISKGAQESNLLYQLFYKKFLPKKEREVHVKYIGKDGKAMGKWWIEKCRKWLIESTIGVLDPIIINDFIDSDIIIDERNNYDGSCYHALYKEFAKTISDIDVMNRYGIIWLKSFCDKIETLFVKFIYNNGYYDILEIIDNDASYFPNVTLGGIKIFNYESGEGYNVKDFYELSKSNKKIEKENYTIQLLSGSLNDAKMRYERLKYEKVFD